MEDHLSKLCYWEWDVTEEQLLRPSYILLFSVKFISFLFLFTLCLFFVPLFCYFYLCNSKHRSQDCKVSNGILLHSEKGLNDYLNYYYLTTIPLKNSFIRNRMCIQKSPKNHPKTKTFQITVVELQAVCLKTMFFFSEVLHFRKNNPQREPADVTVTLLICVRQ